VRRAALVVSGAFVVTGLATAAVGANAVTLSVRQYVNANKVRTFAFSGQVSSGAAGELVTIVGKECTGPGLYQIAAAQTGAGGAWQVETPSPTQPYVQINSGATIRARWKDAESVPYLYRFGLVPYPFEIKRGVVTVRVNPSPLNVKLAGKRVALQRFRANAWTPYLEARLKYRPTLEAGAYNYETVFTVKRGLKLRALVPTATARPCYLAGASKPFRS
jgi:hypothetical protein